MLDVGSLTRDIVTTRNLLAEVGVAGHVLRSSLGGGVDAVDLQRVGDGVVTQASRLVEADDKDAARPRAVAHPELSFFVVEDARIDAVGVILTPVARYVVARGEAGLFADGYLKVGVLVVLGAFKTVVGIGPLETRKDYGTLIDPWTLW